MSVPSGCPSPGTCVGSKTLAYVDRRSVPVWQCLHVVLLWFRREKILFSYVFSGGPLPIILTCLLLPKSLFMTCMAQVGRNCPEMSEHSDQYIESSRPTAPLLAPQISFAFFPPTLKKILSSTHLLLNLIFELHFGSHPPNTLLRKLTLFFIFKHP